MPGGDALVSARPIPNEEMLLFTIRRGDTGMVQVVPACGVGKKGERDLRRQFEVALGHEVLKVEYCRHRSLETIYAKETPTETSRPAAPASSPGADGCAQQD